jgi:hypothetical protein
VGALVGLIGPTTGHIYAGQTWNPGLKWRLISAGALTISVVGFVGAEFPEGDGARNEGAASFFAICLLASAGGYVGSTIYEIATAPGAASRHNRHGSHTSVTVAPMVGRAPGLAVAGTF